MKKLLWAAAAAVLCACSAPQHRFESDPGGYGLFVATTNIFANSMLVVQNEDSGKLYPIRINHNVAGDSAGYAMASLPAGRYHLETYSPDGVNNYPITTANGWFEVQNNCFNFGGRYDFAIGEDNLPVYTNTTTLQDIADLPHHYRDLASPHDVCDAGMGRASERLKYADVKEMLQLE
ncbi:MAG: hypothetical protein ACM3ZT_05720 [Bacillota bacterium]